MGLNPSAWRRTKRHQAAAGTSSALIKLRDGTQGTLRSGAKFLFCALGYRRRRVERAGTDKDVARSRQGELRFARVSATEVNVGVPELIARRVQALPPARQAEVLDFVEFLATRSDAGADWTEHDFTALALASALGEDEDETKYDEADCREIW